MKRPKVSKENPQVIAFNKTRDPREGYDYVGYLNAYGHVYPKGVGGHYTDKFKLPNHPTFSDESIYSNSNTPGGHWRNDLHFEHSDFTFQHPDETLEYMKYADPDAVSTYKGGIVLPSVTIKPHLSEGVDKFTAFAERLGPMVYRGLVDRGVQNIDTAYDNMMRQLAWESSYGLSPVARKQNNYGGYGWNGKTYTTFKNDEDFVNHYLDLMMKRYGAAVNSPDVYTYARNLKNKGYYEDTYEHYSQGLAGMKSMSRAAAKHRKDHPELYDMSMTYIPVDETKMGPDAKGQVRPPKSAQLETPQLTLPIFNIPVVKPKETRPKSRLRQELLPAMMKIAGLENVFGL